MKNVIIDTDPGHDDAIAILTAGAREELNIIAISTVAGNQTLEKINRNTINLISYLGLNIPVASGARKPILKEPTIGDGVKIHGESGMDGFVFPEYNLNIETKNAVEFMYEAIIKSSSKVTLVAIGPLTNIGLLLSRYPDIKNNIEAISIMGGAISGGNVTKDAEFNIYADPDAAKIVFESGITIFMSGLDVTEKAYITFEEIEESLSSNGTCTKMVRGLLDFYSNYYKMHYAGEIHLHDVCAVLYLTNPELFKGTYHSITIDTSDGKLRGKTIINKESANRNVLVLNEVNRNELLKHIFNAIKFFDVKLENHF